MQESDGADSIYTCAAAVRLLCGVQVDPFSFVQFEKMEERRTVREWMDVELTLVALMLTKTL